jgi:hypothetical protein
MSEAGTMGYAHHPQGIVYVVAWRYHDGGAFDWYFTADAADQAYEEEKTNVHAPQDRGWAAYRFDVPLPATLTNAKRQDVTDYINHHLLRFCEMADRIFYTPPPNRSTT